METQQMADQQEPGSGQTPKPADQTAGDEETPARPADRSVMAMEQPPDETAIIVDGEPTEPSPDETVIIVDGKPTGPSPDDTAIIVNGEPTEPSPDDTVIIVDGKPTGPSPDDTAIIVNGEPSGSAPVAGSDLGQSAAATPPTPGSSPGPATPPRGSGSASVVAPTKPSTERFGTNGSASASVPVPVPVGKGRAAAAMKAVTKLAVVPGRAWRVDGLGQAPWVLALSTLGVLMVAIAYAGGRYQTSYPIALYWVGQVVVFTPVVVRLLSRRLAGTTEGFTLVIGLAANQYLLKWMYSPDQFRFPDELQHWLATTIINQTGELFQPNDALPPAVHFPGLAEMGASVSQLTGVSVTAAGLIVAGVVRLCLVAGLYATVQRATKSPTIAGVTCVIYATSLHYLFFDAMYLYQAAALPFLMLGVWATRRYWNGDGAAFAVLSVIGICMTTISHHVTAVVLVLTLLLLAAAEIITKRPRPWRVLLVPAFGLAVMTAWIVFVARDVIDYVAAPIAQAGDALQTLISGNSGSGGGSASAPIWQLGVQAIGLLCLFVLYLAVARDMFAQRDRDSWRWGVLIGGAVFFVGNGVRFLGADGPEIAGRLTTFTYVPIAVAGAYALVNVVRLVPEHGSGIRRWLTPSPPPPPARRVLTPWVFAGAAAVTVLMIGARLGGWPPTASLLPGPYRAASFERSVDEYGIAAADWERTVLGPGHRVGGDITAVSLGSTYGRQNPVRETAPLFYDPRWSPSDDRLVASLGLQYLVVDQRITDSIPVNDAYFDDDPHAGQITKPISVAQIGKFDTIPRMSRLYDNGNVRIYSLGTPQ
jgi:hypothetical protein